MNTHSRAAGPPSPILRIVKATHDLVEASNQVRAELNAGGALEARQLVDDLETTLRQINDLAHALGLYFDGLPRGSGMAPAVSLLSIMQDKISEAEGQRMTAWRNLAAVAA